jgi:5-methylthioadenosine/S-adenosylhomocysteine deaminase
VNTTNDHRVDQCPQEVDWLLTNGWVITCDQRMASFACGALAISGDQLVAVGPAADLESRFAGRIRMDLSGHLVLPGLINAHTHAAMTCFRGLADDLPLANWLSQIIFPAEAAHVNPDSVYWGSLLAAVEMLLGGITTFCDGYFFAEAAARAARDAGIRAILGQGVLDFPAPDQPDPSRARERAENFLNGFPWCGDRLRPSLFCHAPYTCGPETLRWVKALCREQGMLFQIHLSETAAEVTELVNKYGERPTYYLDQLGILDASTLCAHAIWLEPGEIELLGNRGVGVAHAAESNMKLASGVAPVPALLAAGLPVGLGTDGCASNNNLDLFAEMNTVAKLHKAFHRDPLSCPAPVVLRMATIGGAYAIGWDDAIGSLEAGKKADVIAIDYRRPHLTPLYDPVSHLVYAASASDVRHVWVRGQPVVTDGEIRTVEAGAVMREVERLAGAITAARRCHHQDTKTPGNRNSCRKPSPRQF